MQEFTEVPSQPPFPTILPIGVSILVRKLPVYPRPCHSYLHHTLILTQIFSTISVYFNIYCDTYLLKLHLCCRFSPSFTFILQFYVPRSLQLPLFPLFFGILPVLSWPFFIFFSPSDIDWYPCFPTRFVSALHFSLFSFVFDRPVTVKVLTARIDQHETSQVIIKGWK